MTDNIAHEDPRDVERLMDRYWFLLRSGGARAGEGGAGAARTQVARDGDFVVVSIEAAALGWPEGTLLFRFRSETAPCAACVERAAEIARHRTSGRLTSRDVREMLRFAVARCAASRIDPAHAGAREPHRPCAPDPASRAPGSAPCASDPAERAPGSAPCASGPAVDPAPGARHAARDAGTGARRHDADLWLIL